MPTAKKEFITPKTYQIPTHIITVIIIVITDIIIGTIDNFFHLLNGGKHGFLTMQKNNKHTLHSPTLHTYIHL